MNTAIELHDSTVAEITNQHGEIVVLLGPAYLHKSQGRAGIDAGSGWTQEARLIFAEGKLGGSLPELPGWIIDGELLVGAEHHDNLIPVPIEVSTPVKLNLTFDSNQNLTVSGQGVRLELLGEARYVEEFKP